MSEVISLRKAAALLWQQLAANQTGPVWKTRTRVDAGGWGLNPPLHAGMDGDSLVLFAPGKRPYVERLPVSQLTQSRYNHVTGEVILAPAPEARTSRLKVAPVEGAELVAAVQGKGD